MAFWKMNGTPYFSPDKGGGGGTEDEELEKDDELLEDDEIPEDELDDETPPEDDEGDDDKVPLSVLLKEKARRKELERKLKEKELADEEAELSKEKETIKARYVKAGYDPEFAELQAEEQVSQRNQLRKIKDDLEVREFRAELREVAQSDKYFKDALLFEKEIRAKMKAVKGITIEEAYLLVRGGAKRKEFQTDVEQRQAAARRNQLQKGGTTSTGSGTMTSKYKLDPDDRKALAQLQKAQPDAKWTTEKYYKLLRENKERSWL